MQASLSPQSTVVLEQPATGSHASVVQALASLQSGGVPAWHVSPTQVSSPLQRLPSAQSESSVQVSAVVKLYRSPVVGSVPSWPAGNVCSY